jgi:hypothetical protein
MSSSDLITGLVTAAPPSAEELVRRATALVPKLDERSYVAAKMHQIPDENIHDLEESGLFKLRMAREYGGTRQNRVRRSKFLPRSVGAVVQRRGCARSITPQTGSPAFLPTMPRMRSGRPTQTRGCMLC